MTVRVSLYSGSSIEEAVKTVPLISAIDAVPLFWLACFDKPYTGAIELQRARQNFLERSIALSCVAPESLINDWNQFLASIDDQVIVLDSDSEFDIVVGPLLSSFDAKPFLINEQLARQTGCEVGQGIVPLSAAVLSSLVGFGVANPVPWEDREAFNLIKEHRESISKRSIATFKYPRKDPPSAELVKGIFDFHQVPVSWLSPTGISVPSQAVPRLPIGWSLVMNSDIQAPERGVTVTKVEQQSDGWQVEVQRNSKASLKLWDAWLKVAV